MRLHRPKGGGVRVASGTSGSQRLLHGGGVDGPTGAIPYRPVSPTDGAILHAGVVTGSDLSREWDSRPWDRPCTAGYRGIQACNGLKSAIDTARREVPNATSRPFSDPSSSDKATEACDEVFAYRNVNAASDFLAVFRASSPLDCLRRSVPRLLRRSPPPGSTLIGVNVSPITELAVGDDRVGYETASTFTRRGQSFTLVDAVTVVRVGRAGVGFEFVSIDGRIPQAPDIVDTVVARVRQAQS